MSIKESLAKRLEVVQAYGTAEELEQVLAEIAREKEREERKAQREAVGLITPLEKLGEKIEQRRANTVQIKRKQGL